MPRKPFPPMICSMFGYRKQDLESKSLSMLMPAPFSQKHGGYVSVRNIRSSYLHSQRKRRTWFCTTQSALSAALHLPFSVSADNNVSFFLYHCLRLQMKNYASTGVAKILDVKREVVALHRGKVLRGYNNYRTT